MYSKNLELHMLDHENEIKQLKRFKQNSIGELQVKIDKLQQLINDIDITKYSKTTQPKEKKDILIIGDSIVKHLDPKKISDRQTDIHCLPGARCDEISAELSELLKKKHYSHIFLHTGTNYIPQHDPRYISNKILDFLSHVRKLAPTSNVSWSSILPKYDDSFRKGINIINQSIFNKHTMIKRMGLPVNHAQFFKNKLGGIDCELFCHDAVHLSYKGVAALEKSFKYHIDNVI